jgi:hypothetical protein
MEVANEILNRNIDNYINFITYNIFIYINNHMIAISTSLIRLQQFSFDIWNLILLFFQKIDQ